MRPMRGVIEHASRRKLEGELTPRSDNERVLTITVKRKDGPTGIIELRGNEPQGRRPWPLQGH